MIVIIWQFATIHKYFKYTRFDNYCDNNSVLGIASCIVKQPKTKSDKQNHNYIQKYFDPNKDDNNNNNQ